MTAYVLACVILPVLWGSVIHWIFQHIRRRQNSSGPTANGPTVDNGPSPDHWPDYQI